MSRTALAVWHLLLQAGVIGAQLWERLGTVTVREVRGLANRRALWASLSLDKSRPISHVVNVPELKRTIPHAGFTLARARGRAPVDRHG